MAYSGLNNGKALFADHAIKLLPIARHFAVNNSQIVPMYFQRHYVLEESHW
jgi:hypothetical protein